MPTTIPSEVLSASAISIGQSVYAYGIMLPTLREVRRADNDDMSMRQDVYLGLVTSAALTSLIGLMLSSLTDSSIPVVTAGGVSIIMVGAYLYALNGTGVVA